MSGSKHRIRELIKLLRNPKPVEIEVVRGEVRVGKHRPPGPKLKTALHLPEVQKGEGET